MTHQYTTRFHVRQYELNARGDMPNSTLLRLFQETAMRATQGAGFDAGWFAERKTVWVVHQMTLERLRPVHYPEELVFTTWLSDVQKVRTHREYVACNTATGAVVARGRAHWVHLNEKLIPVRIPQDIIDRFQPNGLRAIRHIVPRQYSPTNAPPIKFAATRHVQRYEADEMQHVNNAIYVDWLEEALGDALPAHSQQLPTNARLCIYRHDIEYARAAVPGDKVEISVQLAGAGHGASTWELEIKRGDESLVHDCITALWVDDAGRPVRWKRG